MQKTKLIQILASLSKIEMEGLASFLASPYFNQEQSVELLFECLQGFHPDFESRDLNKQYLFNKVFPEADYDDKQVGYLMSKLNKLAEKFLAQLRLEKDQQQLELALLDELSERGLTKSYRQQERKMKTQLSQAASRSTKYFLDKFQLAEVDEKHFERQRLRRFDDSVERAAKALDQYYYLQRLNLSCAMLDRQRIFQSAYDLQISEEWIIHLEQNDFLGEEIIQLYYTIFQALREEENESHFESLKTYMQNFVPQSNYSDLKDVYLLAINYCARKIRQGKEAYLLEALNLYRSGIRSKALLDDGYLSPWTFTNVVKLSLRLKDYQGVELFIEENAPLLMEAFRENALHYNLAELYYYTNRYDLAQEQLNLVAYSDLNYYLGARVLLAKIYYEQQAEEPLLALLASFTIFLKRNRQLSNNLKHTYLNFCQILFQIVKRSPKQLAVLGDKIQSTSLLTDRQWLLEAYEALSLRS